MDALPCRRRIRPSDAAPGIVPSLPASSRPSPQKSLFADCAPLPPSACFGRAPDSRIVSPPSGMAGGPPDRAQGSLNAATLPPGAPPPKRVEIAGMTPFIVGRAVGVACPATAKATFCPQKPPIKGLDGAEELPSAGRLGVLYPDSVKPGLSFWQLKPPLPTCRRRWNARGRANP
jgi:hypothetical protein